MNEQLREALHEGVELALTLAEDPVGRRARVHGAIDAALDVHAPQCMGFDSRQGPCAVSGWAERRALLAPPEPTAGLREAASELVRRAQTKPSQRPAGATSYEGWVKEAIADLANALRAAPPEPDVGGCLTCYVVRSATYCAAHRPAPSTPEPTWCREHHDYDHCEDAVLALAAAQPTPGVVTHADYDHSRGCQYCGAGPETLQPLTPTPEGE